MSSISAPSSPDVSTSIAALEGQIAASHLRRSELSQERAAAIVGNIQQPSDAVASRVREMSLEIEGLDQDIAAKAEALDQVREAVPALEADANRRAADATFAKARKNAVAVRKCAKALDEALDAAADAHRALRQAIATFSAEADEGVRAADGFDMLQYHVSTLPNVIQARLAHADVLPARSIIVDRSAEPPSVREQIDRAIYGVLPLQGRPKAAGDD